MCSIDFLLFKQLSQKYYEYFISTYNTNLNKNFIKYTKYFSFVKNHIANEVCSYSGLSNKVQVSTRLNVGAYHFPDFKLF